MAFIPYNPNPYGRFVGDCSVRAICKLTGQDWDSVYVSTFLEGFHLKNMPSGNEVWGAYLDRLGYVRRFAPDTCPYCYRVRDFCRDHPRGSYLLALDQHVVAAVNGDYYDTWDSGNEIVLYYWMKGSET